MAKRLFDIVVGAILSVVLAPLILMAAIGSAISFRAWPFYVQDRVGLNGGLFRFVKIRSLPTSTHDAATKYDLHHVQNTDCGRLLRRFHIDELPQLWLVVTGSMSLVGPRPEMPSLATKFDADFAAERVTMRPGCTGLWQVSTASGGLIAEAPEFDTYYTRNWTLRMDLWLLMWTIVETLGGPAIKDLGQVPTWTSAAMREDVELLT